MRENCTFIRNIKEADLAICERADSFLQSAMWGRFKSRFGWQTSAFAVEWTDGGERPLLILSRRIAPGVVMAYVPWGPELPGNWGLGLNSAMTELAHALRPHLRGVAFIRFDPPVSMGNGEWGVGNRGFCSDDRAISESYPGISKSEPHSPLPTPFSLTNPFSLPNPHSPLTRAAADIQPPDTVLLDLSPNEEAILAAMKAKWRYNIGLAEKHGVVVSESGEEGVDVFYRLLSETAERDGIAIHSAGYYRALFEECGAGGEVPLQLRLYTASHEGDALAAIVVLFRGRQATYLYGASANIKRNLMAPYALQWRAMTEAKAFGCTEYDLFGIPPNENPDHPMAGLYRFKTGFGGTIIHRSGSWDYPYKPALYALFSGAERLRKKIRDRGKRRGRTGK